MSDLTRKANRANLAKPEENLVLVDCAGTMYQGDFSGHYNKQLVAYLTAMKSVGYNVQFFSSDPHGSSLPLRMLELELDGQFEFGEVHRKDMYGGEKAYIVIDDDHSSHRVDAAFEYSPTDERIEKTLKYAEGIDTAFGERKIN